MRPLTLGQWLTSRRERAGLTRADLAAVSGLGYTTVGSMERDEHAARKSSLMLYLRPLGLKLADVPTFGTRSTRRRKVSS